MKGLVGKQGFGIVDGFTLQVPPQWVEPMHSKGDVNHLLSDTNEEAFVSQTKAL